MNLRRFSGLEVLIIGFGTLCLLVISFSIYSGDAKKLHLIWYLPLWFGMFCMIHALGGANAGWSKLKKANKMGVPRVVGLEGFNNFLETGEFAE